MKFDKAMDIINEKQPCGFRVHFEHREGKLLKSDYFPEGHEKLIESEEEAWELAKKFARKTRGEYVNIYVIGSDFRPVDGYESQYIRNR